MVSLSLTKEARIYKGKKTASLTSGPGKTGQPLVKVKVLLEENIGDMLSNINHSRILYDPNKSKNKQMGPN